MARDGPGQRPRAFTLPRVAALLCFTAVVIGTICQGLSVPRTHAPNTAIADSPSSRAASSASPTAPLPRTGATTASALSASRRAARHSERNDRTSPPAARYAPHATTRSSTARSKAPGTDCWMIPASASVCDRLHRCARACGELRFRQVVVVRAVNHERGDALVHRALVEGVKVLGDHGERSVVVALLPKHKPQAAQRRRPNTADSPTPCARGSRAPARRRTAAWTE